MSEKRVTQSEKLEMTRLRLAGHTLQEVAKMTGFSEITVRRHLHQAGVYSFRVVRPRKATPELLDRLTALARKGRTRKQIARALKITPSQVVNFCRRYRLKERHYLLFSGELAAQVGVDAGTIEKLVAKGVFKQGHWFTRGVFDVRQAAAVRAHFAHCITPDEAEGWLTVHQVAKELGITADNFNQRRRKGDTLLQSISRRKLIGSGGSGNTYRYNPTDVHRVLTKWKRPAQPLHLKSQGFFPIKALAEMAGRSPDALRSWAKAGAPFTDDLHGRRWMRPDDLLKWLESQSHERYHTAAAALRAALTCEQETARAG